MEAVLEALRGGRLKEMFGTGTACVVCPVGGVQYGGQVGLWGVLGGHGEVWGGSGSGGGMWGGCGKWLGGYGGVWRGYGGRGGQRE